MGVPGTGGPAVSDLDADDGCGGTRLSVRDSNWSWFASRFWVRIWGPADWNRSRNLCATVEADVVMDCLDGVAWKM